jgi:hypothetical protein
VAARAGLSLLNSTGARLKICCKKKALAMAKEVAKEAKEALAKTQDSKLEAKEAEEATKVTDNNMKAGIQEDLEKSSKPRRPPRAQPLPRA